MARFLCSVVTLLTLYGSLPVQSQNTSNATALLDKAWTLISYSPNGILSTHARGVTGELSSDINTRVVSPKPLPRVDGPSSFGQIFIDTNNLSRKYQEIEVSATSGGARVSLLHYDVDGIGYVSMRGNASICSASEARQVWWDGWAPFYPNGSNTSFYSVIRFEPDWMEIVSAGRLDVDAGRADWLPASLKRISGRWEVAVAPLPAPPSPPSPSTWRCNVCSHVYDAKKDGGGVPFEQLPDTWQCPICQAPKSAYRKVMIDGIEEWVHHEQDPIRI